MPRAIAKTCPSAAPNLAALYARAFKEFGAAALWNRPVPDPTPADALVIAHALRAEGDLAARRLAEAIEAAAHAAH